MSKFAYVHKVVGHTRHYFTRFMIVEKGVRQLFQMIEHVASHLSLHFYAHYVSVILNEIVKPHSEEIYAQQRSAANNHHADVVVRYVCVKHCARYHRVSYRNGGNRKRCQHVEKEQQFVRFVVRHKSFKHSRVSVKKLIA